MWWIIGCVVIAAALWWLNAMRWRIPIPENQIEIPQSTKPTHVLLWNEMAYKNGKGRGFTIVREKGWQPLSAASLTVGEANVRSISVVGTRYRPDAIAADAFAVGKEVILRREPENPYDRDAIAVWDRDEELLAGYLPRDDRDRTVVMKQLGTPTAPQAFVMWENLDQSGRRTGARLILVYDGAPIYVPGKWLQTS